MKYVKILAIFLLLAGIVSVVMNFNADKINSNRGPASTTEGSYPWWITH